VLIIAGESLTRSLSLLLRKNAIRGYARTTSTKWRSFLGVLGFRSFVVLSVRALPCVLAISRWPILRRVQAREGEAEKL
jgi:hypothetical protein